MIRVFISTIVESPGRNSVPAVELFNSIPDDTGAHGEIYYGNQSPITGRFDSPTAIFIYYSPSLVPDSVTDPAVDKIPPIRANRAIPALPEQARADLDSIITKHGFTGVIGADIVDTVRNMVVSLNPANASRFDSFITRLALADGEWA